MTFNRHSTIEGQHAFLSASKFSWLNYDEDKVEESYLRYMATQKGTELHDYAKKAIKLGLKQPKRKDTLCMYINDAIGFKMIPEQPLFYSLNCFGTADAICFRDNKLRIHDLKTGVTPAHMEQLYIYSALFCLEYSMKPSDIHIELRIYQNDAIMSSEPEADLITDVMDKIVIFDKRIEKLRMEV